jgi:hypothetical protein
MCVRWLRKRVDLERCVCERRTQHLQVERILGRWKVVEEAGSSDEKILIFDP